MLRKEYRPNNRRKTPPPHVAGEVRQPTQIPVSEAESPPTRSEATDRQRDAIADKPRATTTKNRDCREEDLTKSQKRLHPADQSWSHPNLYHDKR